MKIFKRIRSEKGSALVLVAAAMVGLAGMAALVIDVGQMYIDRAEIAKALDCAVLAGTQHLPENAELALDTAERYAQLNGLSPEEYEFGISNADHTLSGQAHRRVLFHFARILGHEAGEVAARAAARVAPVTSVTGIVPFGVLENDFAFGQLVILKEGAGENDFNGWFGALRLGGNGARVYEQNIKEGYQGTIAVGDIIPVEPGNMSGPTCRGVEHRIDQCRHSPQCTIHSYVESCSRLIMVPMVRIVDANHGAHPHSVEVVGFAAFLINRYTGHGQDNQVEGAFVRYVAPGETTGEAADYGLYSAYLCE